MGDENLHIIWECVACIYKVYLINFQGCHWPANADLIRSVIYLQYNRSCTYGGRLL
jgi:hypothetical protein